MDEKNNIYFASLKESQIGPIIACCNPSLAFCPPSFLLSFPFRSVPLSVSPLLFTLSPSLAYHSIKVKQCGSLNEVTVMSLLKVTTQRSSVLANMFILQCHQWQGHTAPFLPPSAPLPHSDAFILSPLLSLPYG